MAKSMLTKGDPRQKLSEKKADFPKRRDSSNFQRIENDVFNRVLDTNRRVKKRYVPRYRRIRTYCKSTKQYWKERNRRKKARKLSAQGFTYEQIGEKLGVSLSTVKRDMKKLRPYILGQFRREMRLFDEQRQREFNEQMEGLSLWQQFALLSQELDRRRKLLQGSPYRGHYTIFYLDLTETDQYGIPKLTQLPHQTKGQPLAYPYKIRVVVKGSYEGRTFEATIGGFNIVQTRRW